MYKLIFIGTDLFLVLIISGNDGDALAVDDFPEKNSVKPKPGRAALFDSQILHCGNKVLNGCKYLLRTDVMTN